jgi:hypothetical protein
MIGQPTKSKVERRLQKLEAALTDDSRAVPHTHKWLLYWTEQIGKYMSGEWKPVAPFIPLEAFRAVMKACDGGGSLGGDRGSVSNFRDRYGARRMIAYRETQPGH